MITLTETERKSRFEQEIAYTNNRVINGVRNRRVHPSYGYTKKSLLAEYNKLHGFIEAHRMLFGEPNSEMNNFDYADRNFDIQLLDLFESIKDS